MQTKSADDIKAGVLKLFAGHPNQQFKAEEIARRISAGDDASYATLLRVLHELHRDKQVSRTQRKKYGHLAAPATRMEGVVSMTKQGVGIVRLLPPAEGTVAVSPRFLSTALHGDTVTVALLASPRDGTGRDLPEGEVVEVVRRSNEPVVGVFQKSKHFFFVVPDDGRFGRDIYVAKGKTMGARPGQKVVCVVDDWLSRNLNPEGHVTEVLGTSGEVRAEMASVARQFKLPLRFAENVRAEAAAIPPAILAEEIRRRLDLRADRCFTIDPEDAKDFDDAVSIESRGSGGFRLGVHIADVSHYVREGTALDAEALKRGTSVYLANEVIPMLPEELSNVLCSLRPKEDRLTFSVLMDISPDGTVASAEIAKTVIHSKRRFTYEEVQAIIEQGKGPFAEEIAMMHGLSRTLLRKRMKEGSIDFDSSETKFKYGSDGKPVEIVRKPRLDAHRLVEEFMLLANQTVARQIAGLRKTPEIAPFIYRVHDAPDPERLKDLAAFVEHFGYALHVRTGVTSRSIQKLLDDVRGKEEENVVNEVAIRSMAKAVYSDGNIGHFGLGFRHYTHFTSPIRRYPDLIVHRLVNEYARAMGAQRRKSLASALPGLCKHCSDTERVAMEAERASVKVMQVEYMKRHLGDEFHAIISGVTNFGMFVEISDLLVEGLIRMRDLGDDYYVYDEKKYSLVGRRSKKRYRLGDKVVVRVVRVDPEEREIDFLLIDQPARR